MSKSVFSEDFLKTMTEYLEKKTEGGKCVTRTQLCQDLDVHAELANTIGVIFKLGYLPPFRIWMGPNGGIGRSDVKPPKKEREPGEYTTKLSEDDSVLILAKLNEMCTEELVAIPRKTIAAALGDPSTKMENLISAALKLPEFSGFDSKKGKGGGVFKRAKTASVPMEASTPDPQQAPMTLPSVPEETAGPKLEPLDTELEERLALIKSPLERKWARSEAENKYTVETDQE